VPSGTPGIVRCVAKSLKIPYTSVSDVEAFFERVETIGEPKPPKKVDSAWVEIYGFQTAHPSAIPSMLRWLGVINEEGESTGVWNELRVDSTRQATLQRLVKEAYKGIFDAVDVEKAAQRDLRGAFVSVYSLGDPGRQIKCFLALCQQAGIKTAVETNSRERESNAKQNGDAKPKAKAASPKDGSRTDTSKHRTLRKVVSKETSGVTVALNVEIPPMWTEDEIRERIAAVMRALESADTGDS
jgi:hypothetical protein